MAAGDGRLDARGVCDNRATMTDEVSPREAAARLGATTRSVQRWIASGRLPARRVGGRWRVAIGAIDAISLPDSLPGATPSPIRRLFIANRGEIAVRIARTCRHLGIDAIAAATDGPNAVDLLSVEAVVGAARRSGADAVHPGFGFLAESAELADAVQQAGMRWVGPPPEAIRTMGDKAAARKLAASLGIPIVAGYDDADQSDKALERAALGIGLPVIVKPAAGGGGKGMRTVRAADDLPAALAAARREATVAFGDDRLILERLVEGPRHVEVQVLFDRYGSGVHLGERDCSIQRRHQKVLEETPSPGLDPSIRTQLSDASIALASAVGYVGAGTCEFLVGDLGEVAFLEMNTRLQVEHPITEAVTGRDLVADQLRIAAGEPLGFAQADVTVSGHAIEARLYAEDAENGFLPAVGRIAALRWPAGDGVRVDAGVEAAAEVTGRFDPMLAKVIAHGRDRNEAVSRLREALDETIVLGLTTNLRFLRWLIREPVVTNGQARIDTLDRLWPPDAWTERARIPDDAWVAAARALGAEGWRLNSRAVARLGAEGETRSFHVPEAAGHPPPYELVRVGDTVHVDVGGRSIAFRIAAPPDVDAAARAAAAAQGQAGGRSELVAPMPGAVLAVHGAVGGALEAGAPVVTLEAMKMEHVVVAPVAGHLADVLVAAGSQVVRGQLLAAIEP